MIGKTQDPHAPAEAGRCQVPFSAPHNPWPPRFSDAPVPFTLCVGFGREKPSYVMLTKEGLNRVVTVQQPTIYRTIINVPIPIKIQPINDFAVNFSCKNTNAKTNVITTLNLSIGTTFDASPNCKAL